MWFEICLELKGFPQLVDTKLDSPGTRLLVKTAVARALNKLLRRR